MRKIKVSTITATSLCLAALLSGCGVNRQAIREYGDELKMQAQTMEQNFNQSACKDTENDGCQRLKGNIAALEQSGESLKTGKLPTEKK